MPEARSSGIDKKRLLADVRRLGVRPGHLVMVHASLRKLGLARTIFGEGGADLLLDALDEAVGPDGTLMMTLGSDYAADIVTCGSRWMERSLS